MEYFREYFYTPLMECLYTPLTCLALAPYLSLQERLL